MEVSKEINLQYFLERTTIKSLINKKKVNSLGILKDKKNFDSHLDFYSDYVYSLYVDNKELVEVYGSPVLVVNSVKGARNRVMVDSTGFQGPRGNFNRIRKLNTKEISNKYVNEFKNYEFEEGSDMLGYKLKSLVNYQNFSKDMTKVGNYFTGVVKFTFSTLDLVEKNVDIEVERDFIVFKNIRYKINSIIPEKYLNNEIFLLSFECDIEKPKVG